MDISYEWQDSVALLTWDDGENRINVDSLGRLHELLDELEAKDDAISLVLTGVGKFFSNGLDLDRFGHDADEFAVTLAELKRTVGRLMVFPAYTVAAINGHIFAGGALLGCGFDFRVMREDRGYWCMNEAEIGLALDDQLWAIIHHRLPKATAIVAATTARRYSGPDALAAGIVEATAVEDHVLAHALEVAERYSTLHRSTLLHHKRLAHGEVAASLGFKDE
jgi:Delta3-Delta2-enoyl-CoA isomerase